MDICQAIKGRNYISVTYNGYQRVLQPAAHGVSSAGNQVLRAYQTEGGSASGVMPGWKMMSLNEISNFQILDKTFTGNPPGFKPGDRGMTTVHCELT